MGICNLLEHKKKRPTPGLHTSVKFTVSWHKKNGAFFCEQFNKIMTPIYQHLALSETQLSCYVPRFEKRTERRKERSAEDHSKNLSPHKPNQIY